MSYTLTQVRDNLLLGDRYNPLTQKISFMPPLGMWSALAISTLLMWPSHDASFRLPYHCDGTQTELECHLLSLHDARLADLAMQEYGGSLDIHIGHGRLSGICDEYVDTHGLSLLSDGKRYIILDEWAYAQAAWLPEDVGASSMTYTQFVYILMHELGHHLDGHFDDKFGMPKLEQELRADIIAGQLMALLAHQKEISLDEEALAREMQRFFHQHTSENQPDYPPHKDREALVAWGFSHTEARFPWPLAERQRYPVRLR